MGQRDEGRIGVGELEAGHSRVDGRGRRTLLLEKVAHGGQEDALVPLGDLLYLVRSRDDANQGSAGVEQLDANRLVHRHDHTTVGTRVPHGLGLEEPDLWLPVHELKTLTYWEVADRLPGFLFATHLDDHVAGRLSVGIPYHRAQLRHHVVADAIPADGNALGEVDEVTSEQLAVVGAAIDAAVADIRHEDFVGQREHTRESHTDLTRPSARPTNRVRVESLGVEDSNFLRLEVCDVDVARVVGIDADDLAELVPWLSEQLTDREYFLEGPRVSRSADAFEWVVNDLDTCAVGDSACPSRRGIAGGTGNGDDGEESKRSQSRGRSSSSKQGRTRVRDQ